jgi:hypothetical protein
VPNTNIALPLSYYYIALSLLEDSLYIEHVGLQFFTVKYNGTTIRQRNLIYDSIKDVFPAPFGPKVHKYCLGTVNETSLSYIITTTLLTSSRVFMLKFRFV